MTDVIHKIGERRVGKSGGSGLCHAAAETARGIPLIATKNEESIQNVKVMSYQSRCKSVFLINFALVLLPQDRENAY